jgi:hypothetical protein
MATILLCPQRKKVSCSSKMHHHDTGITDSWKLKMTKVE